MYKYRLSIYWIYTNGAKDVCKDIKPSFIVLPPADDCIYDLTYSHYPWLIWGAWDMIIQGIKDFIYEICYFGITVKKILNVGWGCQNADCPGSVIDEYGYKCPSNIALPDNCEPDVVAECEWWINSGYHDRTNIDVLRDGRPKLSQI